MIKAKIITDTTGNPANLEADVNAFLSGIADPTKLVSVNYNESRVIVIYNQ